MELLIPKDDYIVHALAILLESTLITKVYYRTLVYFSVSSWGIIYVLLHLFIDSITMWTVVWYHPSVCKYTSWHRHSKELTRPHFSGGVLISLFSYKCTFPLIVVCKIQMTFNFPQHNNNYMNLLHDLGSFIHLCQ